MKAGSNGRCRPTPSINNTKLKARQPSSMRPAPSHPRPLQSHPLSHSALCKSCWTNAPTTSVARSLPWNAWGLASFSTALKVFAHHHLLFANPGLPWPAGRTWLPPMQTQQIGASDLIPIARGFAFGARMSSVIWAMSWGGGPHLSLKVCLPAHVEEQRPMGGTSRVKGTYLGP